MKSNIKIDSEFLSGRLLFRENNSHKGDYGHLYLVCGCDAMPGAASLATAAALKSGCGLVTVHTSSFAAQVCAVSNPSAILSIDSRACFSEFEKDMDRYNVVAAGPGLGRHHLTVAALRELMAVQHSAGRPMLLDADALNIIAEERELIKRIPSGSILTPHDGELARLMSWSGDEGKFLKTQELADTTGCIIVSKGYHTKIYVAGQKESYENTTGNPGMAKGGSGDVLTGLIGGLLARGYDSTTAAMLGVWIHGYAGDCCTRKYGMESYNSLDLVDSLYLGFNELFKFCCKTGGGQDYGQVRLFQVGM